MTGLVSMDTAELEALLKEWGEPRFRAKQVFSWLSRGVKPENMTNLPKTLRNRLSELAFDGAEIYDKFISQKDGTIKYLFSLSDGNIVEGVLMRYHYGNTLCISTQVGCRMGCKFCASTLAGKVRDLKPSEMLDQVLFTQLDSGKEISNIVLMGIGEPLDNRQNVLRFLELINHPDGMNIGMRHISLSTCGVVPGIVLAMTGYHVTAQANTLPKDPSAWFYAMLIYALVGCALLLFCFSQTKERVVMDQKETANVKVSDLWKEFLRNRPLRVLALFFITAFAMMSVGNAAGAYFMNDLELQTPEAQEGIRWLVCVIPAMLLVLAMFIISKYELTDEKVDEINEEIERRHMEEK